jgi:hypothetical protein
MYSYESVQSSLPKNNLNSNIIEENKYFGVGMKNLSKIKTNVCTQSSIESSNDDDNFYKKLLKNENKNSLNMFSEAKSLISNHTNANLTLDNANLFKNSIYDNPPQSHDMGMLSKFNLNLNTFNNLFSSNQDQTNCFNLIDSNDKNSSQVVSVSNNNSESSKPQSICATKMNFKMFNPSKLNLNMDLIKDKNQFQEINKKNLINTNLVKTKFEKESSLNKEIKKTKAEESDEEKGLNTGISTTDNLSDEQESISSDCSQEWETTGDNLVDAFLHQVDIINDLSSSLRFDSEDDIENETFDKEFNKELKEMKKNNEKEFLNLHFAPENQKMSFVDFKSRDQKIKLKKKKNYKMLYFCKSLHFFDEKSYKIPCPLCGMKLSHNGMGGHMSKNHPKQSNKFKRRQNTTKLRKIIKKKNDQLKHLGNQRYE